MTRVVLSPEAQADSDAILKKLAASADLAVSRRHADRFDAACLVQSNYPDVGSARYAI